MAKLTTPRIRVILADGTADDEGTEHTVRVLNADMVAFDRDRGRYGWPDGRTAPMLWATYLAWKALTRTGEVPPQSLADFEARALQVEMITDDDGSDVVDPTRTGPGPE